MRPDWEVWLDANISPIIAKWMSEEFGMEVKSAYSLSTKFMSDVEVYQKAKGVGNVILVSKDADFAELISRLGSPPKLINIRVGNCSNRELWNRIQKPASDAVKILTTSDIEIGEID